jgi:hypothetical protein
MVGSIKTDGMHPISLIEVQLMLHVEMLLETVRCSIHGAVILQFFSCLIANSCVEDESICNVIYLVASIRLLLYGVFHFRHDESKVSVICSPII